MYEMLLGVKEVDINILTYLQGILLSKKKQVAEHRTNTIYFYRQKNYRFLFVCLYMYIHRYRNIPRKRFRNLCQWSNIIFCKGPDGKYFWLCRTYNCFCCIFSMFLFLNTPCKNKIKNLSSWNVQK